MPNVLLLVARPEWNIMTTIVLSALSWLNIALYALSWLNIVLKRSDGWILFSPQELWYLIDTYRKKFTTGPVHNAQSIKRQPIDLTRFALFVNTTNLFLVCLWPLLFSCPGLNGDGDIGDDDVSDDDVSVDDEDDGDGVSGGGGGGGQGVWKGSPGARRHLIGFSTGKSSLGESELWSSWSWS